MGALGTIFAYVFVVAWLWFTYRLKTKKHTIIRISVSLLLTLFNIIVLISSLIDASMLDNISLTLVLIFYSIFLLLWVIRLITDILFLSKKNFLDEETELKERIKNKFNIS